MTGPRILLASASPRRRRLIGWLGVDAVATATDTIEDLTAPLSPDLLTRSLAAEKALAARRGHGGDATILAFDTVVVAGGRVLGKPVDENDARRMLRGLSGAVHEVVTGVALLPAGATEPDTFSVATPVSMRALDDGAIDAWVAEGEALGCAGAYNIERHLASVADDQCFQNVAGLPLCHLYAALASDRAGGVPEGLIAPVAACDAALGRHCALGPQVCADAG